MNDPTLYHVRESSIHGRGLFASCPIPADTLIGRLEGPRVMEDGAHVLWIESEDGSLHGIDGQNELRFTNHAPDANAEFLGDELWSKRPIAEGEEITFHYGEEWE